MKELAGDNGFVDDKVRWDYGYGYGYGFGYGYGYGYGYSYGYGFTFVSLFYIICCAASRVLHDFFFIFFINIS